MSLPSLLSTPAASPKRVAWLLREASTLDSNRAWHCRARSARRLALCGLTFELTPRAEAGGVSPVRDDATRAADRAYDACRSESGVERVVRHHRLFVATFPNEQAPTTRSP